MGVWNGIIISSRFSVLFGTREIFCLLYAHAAQKFSPPTDDLRREKIFASPFLLSRRLICGSTLVGGEIMRDERGKRIFSMSSCETFLRFQVISQYDPSTWMQRAAIGRRHLRGVIGGWCSRRRRIRRGRPAARRLLRPRQPHRRRPPPHQRSGRWRWRRSRISRGSARPTAAGQYHGTQT